MAAVGGETFGAGYSWRNNKGISGLVAAPNANWQTLCGRAIADWLLTFLPPERVVWFQRGIGRDRFHPRLRNLQWLREEYCLPAVPVILFVGRVDASKNVLLLTQAAQALVNPGKAFHVLNRLQLSRNFRAIASLSQGRGIKNHWRQFMPAVICLPFPQSWKLAQCGGGDTGSGVTRRHFWV